MQLVANEEREHVGEFARLLEILTGDEEQWLAQGREEVDEMAAEMAAPGKAARETAESAAPEGGARARWADPKRHSGASPAVSGSPSRVGRNSTSAGFDAASTRNDIGPGTGSMR